MAKMEATKILGSNVGLSVTLVIAIICGIVANLKMISDMGEQYVRIDTTLANLVGDIGELKITVLNRGQATNADLRELRNNDADLRERMTRLESLIKKR